jgi:oligopeptide/dipeptide ABC transporter ATP-binding protein
VLGLLKKVQDELALSVMFVTHDLRLVSHVADRVIVMYAGRVVESGPTSTVLSNPKHAYTRDLLACTTTVAISKGTRLSRIPGGVPDLANLPSGCAYHPRCQLATDVCRTHVPTRDQTAAHEWSCHHPEGSVALAAAGDR